MSTCPLPRQPIVIAWGACLPFSPPSASDFYQAHQPALFFKEVLGAEDLRTSNALSSSFSSKRNSYEADSYTSLITSAYPGSPEKLIQDYQEVVLQDMEAVGLFAETVEMTGAFPNQKWTYSAEDFRGEVSIRVTPTEGNNLTIAIWKAEQSL